MKNLRKCPQIYYLFQETCLKNLCLLDIRKRNNCSTITTKRKDDFPLLSNITNYYLHGQRFTISSKVTRFSSPKKEELLKNKDRIPSEFNLIYKSPIDKYVILGQRISSVGMIGLLGVGASELHKLSLPQIEFPVSHLLNNMEFTIMYFALAGSVLSVMAFISKFPLRLYHNPLNDEYIAIFVNLLGLPSKMCFDRGQVEKLKPSGQLPWKNDKFSIQSKTVILLENHFRLPEDYNSLLNIKSKDV